jgi:rhodanese-related sulfurtransferase
VRIAKPLSALMASGILFLSSPPNVPAQPGMSRYTVITAAELKKLVDTEKDILLIDNLAFSRYRQEHIQGAKNFEFPNENMERWDHSKTGGKSQEDFIALLGGDKDRPIVFYCLDAK